MILLDLHSSWCLSVLAQNCVIVIRKREFLGMQFEIRILYSGMPALRLFHVWFCFHLVFIISFFNPHPAFCNLFPFSIFSESALGISTEAL